MKKFLKVLLAASAAIGISSQAAATSYSCGPTSITHIGQRSEGNVSVHTNFGSFIFCNVSATFYDVGAETCRGWVAQLLTARGLGKPVTFHFDNGHAANTTLAACSTSNFNGSYRVPFLIQTDFSAP